MTQILVLLMTAFAGFLLADPFYGGILTKSPVAKWPLLAVSFGALGFHLVGRALTDPERLRRAAAEVLATWWPLLFLSVFIIGGSVFARYGNDVKENFLGMGLGMLYLPMAALALRSSATPMGFLKGLASVYTLTVLTVLAVLLSGTHVFHEEIFLAVPLGVYFLTARPLRTWQVVLGLALMAACVYSFKNTTFLLVLATLAACMLVWAKRLLGRHTGLGLSTGLVAGVPLVLVAGAGAALAWWRLRKNLPSGNVEYRVEMYGIAWQRFLDSPIWGTGFTESSVNYFELYRVATLVQSLPTHSDVLDLLAQGGLIAIGLWLVTMWRLAAIAFDAFRHVAVADGGPDPRAWRWLCVLGLVQLCAVITYAVNPPLISPVHAFWVWASAGAMWALHRTLTNPLPVPVAMRHTMRRKTAWA